MGELLYCILIRFTLSAAFGRKEGNSVLLHDFAAPTSTWGVQAGLQRSHCAAFVSSEGHQCCIMYLLKQRKKHRNRWKQNRCDRFRTKLDGAMIHFLKSPHHTTTTNPAWKSKPKPLVYSMQAKAAANLRAKSCNTHTDCPVQQFCGAPDPDEDPQSTPLCFKCSGCERDVDGITPCSLHCGQALHKAATQHKLRSTRGEIVAPRHSTCQKHTDCAAHQFCAAADLEEDPQSKPKCFMCSEGCEFDVDGVSPCRKHCALAARYPSSKPVSARYCATHSDCLPQHFCGAADPAEDQLDTPMCYACAECERDIDGVTPCIQWCTE